MFRIIAFSAGLLAVGMPNGCCDKIPNLPPDLDTVATQAFMFEDLQPTQRLADAFFGAVDPVENAEGCWGRLDTSDTTGNAFASVYAFDFAKHRARFATAPVGAFFAPLLQISEYDFEQIGNNRLLLTFKTFIGWDPIKCKYVKHKSTTGRREQWLVSVDGDLMALVSVNPDETVEDVANKGVDVQRRVFQRFECDNVFGSPLN